MLDGEDIADIPPSFLRAWYRLPRARRLAITRAIIGRLDVGERVIDAFRVELGWVWVAATVSRVLH